MRWVTVEALRIGIDGYEWCTMGALHGLGHLIVVDLLSGLRGAIPAWRSALAPDAERVQKRQGALVLCGALLSTSPARLCLPGELSTVRHRCKAPAPVSPEANVVPA